KEEGEYKKEREIVINGLQQGLDTKVIAALTGLSVAEIEKIAGE
ncbi:MAG: flagellar assembly protein H, partial [Candidatus Electrothrix sp. AR1]|nr:flagellar assembly protein H [Candidatus Electrothrix sp. AR1]